MIKFECPSAIAFESRKIFHSCQRTQTDSVNEWLNRIENSIAPCEYGALNDVMFIDKFLSGLDGDDFAKLSQLATWSELQLRQFISENNLSNESSYKIPDNEINFIPIPDVVIKEENSNENVEDHFIGVDDHQMFYGNECESDIKSSLGNLTTEANEERMVEHENSKKIFLELKQKKMKKEDPSRSFVCQLCNADCFCRSRLDVHMRKHEHMNKSFECYICGIQYPRMLGLKVHFSRMHIELKRERLSCTECDKTYSERGALERHIRIHKGLAQIHKCPHCDKEFELRCRMLAHMASHSDMKEEHICEICGQIYGSNKLLNMHRRTHSKMRYKCQICGLLLKNSSTYRIHQRQHTGERPHQCSLCPKSFVTAPSYKKHLMVHNKIKPHACTICPGRFATPYHLKVHMNRHTGDKPYMCLECNTRFSQPQSLNTHNKRFHQQENNKSQNEN